MHRGRSSPRQSAAVLALVLVWAGSGVGLTSSPLSTLSVVRQTMVGHDDSVNCLKMVGETRLLLSGSEDGSTRACAPFQSSR